jgi:hypothetical protein
MLIKLKSLKLGSLTACLIFWLCAANTLLAAEKLPIDIVGELSIGWKSMDLSIRDREITPNWLTLGLSLTGVIEPFYLTLHYEESVDEDIQGEPSGLLFLDRRDAHVELSYNVWKELAVSVGYRVGETDAHSTASNDSFGTSEEGFFIGGSYWHSFGKKGTLTGNLAIADLKGKVSFREPFVDTSAFVVGESPPQNIEGDALGVSFALNWTGPLGDNTFYLVGLKLQRFEFEDQVVFGGLDLSYEQNFDSASIGLVHRF